MGLVRVADADTFASRHALYTSEEPEERKCAYRVKRNPRASIGGACIDRL